MTRERAVRLEIKGLAQWRERLSRVRPDEVMAHGLEEHAQRLAQTVQDALSTPPGTGDHDRPWARTGALRDSIAVTASGLEAAVGSNDPAAAPQEIGTSRIPPRPFLAPAASGAGREIATSIGRAVSDVLNGPPTST